MPAPHAALFPHNTVPPSTLPTKYPPYNPHKIVTGHLCQSRSQSNGIGTAPNHAPTNPPTHPPNVSSTGAWNEPTAAHAAPSTPWT